MRYSETLARLRKERGLTQTEVADYLNKHADKKYGKANISSWEKGAALPPIHQFLLLCELYGAKDIQETFRGVENDYRGLPKLNALGKSRVEEYIATLLFNPLFVESEDENYPESMIRTIKLYDIPVAAGSGEFLDSDAYEDLEVDDTVPNDADFAVRVSGDSMEPRFAHGQVVFIRKQNVLEVGDIGIFSRNGDAYIKKLGQGELVSLNPRYLAIQISESDVLHIFGKVVG